MNQTQPLPDAGQVTEETVSEYQRLVKARYGLDLPAEEASDQVIRLLTFFRWLFRPMTKAEFDTIMEMADPRTIPSPPVINTTGGSDEP